MLGVHVGSVADQQAFSKILRFKALTWRLTQFCPGQRSVLSRTALSTRQDSAQYSLGQSEQSYLHFHGLVYIKLPMHQYILRPLALCTISDKKNPPEKIMQGAVKFIGA